MPLLKEGQVIEDRWVLVTDDAPLPDDRPVVVSHARWLADKDSLQKRNAPLGIVLPNTLDVLGFGAEATRFGLIVLQFPKFSDGRAYSQACCASASAIRASSGPPATCCATSCCICTVPVSMPGRSPVRMRPKLSPRPCGISLPSTSRPAMAGSRH